MADIPVILLGAGGSLRMGRPKQLMIWDNKTLIEHQVEMIRKTGARIFVVLGAYSELIFPLIENKGVEIIINKKWEDGMGSSIAEGINGVTRLIGDPAGIMITLTDQPLIDTGHYKNLIMRFQPGNQSIIVSSSGNGWEGAPALFDRCYFPELRSLNGDKGARMIIEKYRQYVIAIECDQLLDDLDTGEDYMRLSG